MNVVDGDRIFVTFKDRDDPKEYFGLLIYDGEGVRIKQSPESSDEVGREIFIPHVIIREVQVWD